MVLRWIAMWYLLMPKIFFRATDFTSVAFLFHLILEEFYETFALFTTLL
jgi:hypothetical protein